MILTFERQKQETPTVSTFYFHAHEPFVHIPGQHLSMRLSIEKPDNRGIVRMFTISSSPTEHDRITITTRRGVSSFKQALFGLVPGQTVEVRGPGGMFVMNDEAPGYYLFAGGIGITPFRSMLRNVADTKQRASITLLYSCKTEEEIVFHEELRSFASQMPSVDIRFAITAKEHVPVAWNGIAGRLTEQVIAKECPEIARRLNYVCGPASFVVGISDAIKRVHQAATIYTEQFSGYV